MAKKISIGVLSDTHLSGPTDYFKSLVNECFRNTSIILHAGDLTDISVLQVFDHQEVHAVHGNMCRQSAYSALPSKKIITAGPFKIGIIHRVGFSYAFENLLLNEFDEMVDCIVYGHTHLPVCHKNGGVLYVNPGSFMPIGRHTSQGTYALLSATETSIDGKIYQVPKLQG